MKILKSGVEMTPEAFSKTRGGKRCACNCPEGFVSGELWVGADEVSECECGCTVYHTFNGSLVSALAYPY